MRVEGNELPPVPNVESSCPAGVSREMSVLAAPPSNDPELMT